MTDSTSNSIDLRTYLRPLRSRWWIVLVIAAFALGFTYQYYSGKPTRYSASTTLLLKADDSDLNRVDPDRSAREQSVIIRTRAVAGLVAQELGLPANQGLPGSVSAVPASGTGFLTLTSVSSDRRSAIELVNAYARVYVDYSGEAGRKEARAARISAEQRLEQIPDIPQNRLSRQQLELSIQTFGVRENASQSKAQQIEPAVAASSLRASPGRNAIFAFVLGAMLGLGIVYALEHLDRRLKRLDEVAELYDSPVLVAIPAATAAAKASRLELKLEPPLTEAFRTLRTTLQLQATDLPGSGVAPRAMLVTSAVAGEGKSTIARSLALAYYGAGLRVALVDADMRRSTVAENFDLDQEPGLADVLRGSPLIDALHVVWHEAHEIKGQPAGALLAGGTQAQPSVVSAEGRPRFDLPLAGGLRPLPDAVEAPTVHRLEEGAHNGAVSGPRLSVLTSGKAPRDPAALLAGGPVAEVLGELQASHDIVIVDTSPLLPISDAVPLLAAVDGVLIVSRIGVTTRHAAEQLTDLLARVPSVNVLGVVANDVRAQAGYGYAET